MERKLREEVWRRSSSRCEYCQLPQEFSDATHEIDHIVAEKHAGQTVSENLALACFPCNNHKGANIAGIDPVSQSLVRLFHPRKDVWGEHFSWNGSLLVGETAIGRTTVMVLEINLRHRALHRASLIEEGVFPPT